MAAFSVSAPFSAIATPYTTAGPGADPLFERIVVEDQLLDPPSSLKQWSGAPSQAAEHATNPFYDEEYLLLYDLCRGDIALLDTIRDPESTSPVAPKLATNPRIPVSIEGHTPPTSDTNATLFSACGPSSLLSSVVALPPSQDRRASVSSSGVRYNPYSKAGRSEVLIQSKETDNSKPGMKRRRQSQLSKEDYIKAYGVNSIRRLDGLDNVDLNSPQAYGQWREILVDALEQIGLPYSVYGLKRLIARAYGLKIIRGQKKHPENRWQVCHQYNLYLSMTDNALS